MAETIFFRLLASDDKGGALLGAIGALRDGRPDNPTTYAVEAESFRQVPGTPFAYWVSERIRRMFAELPPFEGDGRTVCVGLQTGDDFRFVRAWWEVPPEQILDAANGPSWREDPTRFQAWCRQRTAERKQWSPFAKGGEYSPYHADIHLTVSWANHGREIRAFSGSYPRNDSSYFRAGLTWPSRTNSNFGIRAMAAGCVFGHKGPAAFVDPNRQLTVLGILFSKAYQSFLELSMAAGDETQSGTPSRSYEVGIVQKLPWASLDDLSERRINDAMSRILDAVQTADTCDETTHLFKTPVGREHTTLREQAARRIRELEETQSAALGYAARIDESAARLLDVDTDSREDVFGEDAGTLCSFLDRELPEDFDAVYAQSIHFTIRDELDESGGSRAIAVKSFYVSRHLEVLSRVFHTSPRCIARTAAERGLVPDGCVEDQTLSVVSWCFGSAVGRWDVRVATHAMSEPDLPDPFDPVAVCPPGMLVGPDGLPVRDAPPDYPLRVSWDGVLVDDAGFGGGGLHREDVVRRARDVLTVLWGDRADRIENEACEILGVPELRDWFRRPNGFFQDHLRRYSKSRRKAPIYWPLSTRSGDYTLWVYYHRFTDQTFYTLVNKFVEPKIDEVQRSVAAMERDVEEGSGRAAARTTDRIAEVQSFLSELSDLRDELLRVAGLPYKPNLNDGVIINAAPLHRLFRHRQWAKDTEAVWKKLENGDYDWSHMAYTIWPDRVKDVCKKDLSIAIAHGLEELYEGPKPGEKKKRKARKKAKTEAAS